MSTAKDRAVLDAVVEYARLNMADDPAPWGRPGMSVDAAIEQAMHTDIDFNFSNNGNSWSRTTGSRWGLTHRGVKQALRNRNYI